MNFQLNYRGRPYEQRSVTPQETVKEVQFRGRTTLVSPPATSSGQPSVDLQFFGWHPEGLILA